MLDWEGEGEGGRITGDGDGVEVGRRGEEIDGLEGREEVRRVRRDCELRRGLLVE